MKNKQIIVLAGGFGTRLKSVLNGLPKPLADINGTPFLKFIVENLINQGFNDFIFSLHYEADQIVDFLIKENLREKNIKIRFVVEKNPLGTGGAISNVIQETDIDDEFYVTNADTYIANDLDKLDVDVLNLIGVVKVKDTNRYGSVQFNSKGKILEFSEKKFSFGEGYINAGIYKLKKNIFTNWDHKPFSIESDLFPKLVNKGLLNAIKMDTYFIDIGVPEDYNKFCELKKIIT